MFQFSVTIQNSTSSRPCLNFQLMSRWQTVLLRAVTTLDNYNLEKCFQRKQRRFTLLHVSKHHETEAGAGDPERRELLHRPPNGKKIEIRIQGGDLSQQHFSSKTMAVFFSPFESHRYLWLRTEHSEYSQGHSCKGVSCLATLKGTKNKRRKANKNIVAKHRDLGTGFHIWPWPTEQKAVWRKNETHYQSCHVVMWSFTDDFSRAEFWTTHFCLVSSTLSKYVLHQWPFNLDPVRYEAMISQLLLCLFKSLMPQMSMYF